VVFFGFVIVRQILRKRALAVTLKRKAKIKKVEIVYEEISVSEREDSQTENEMK
jgi:hypothetical protein